MSGVMDHANIFLKIDAKLLNALDLSTADDPFLITIAALLQNGTGAGQSSQMWHDTRSLAGSASENLDLAGGGLTNAFGVALTFTKIKYIFVRAKDTNNAANNVNVLRGASNGVPLFLANGDGMPLSPGAWMCFFDPTGVTVTAGTGDILTVTNSAGTNTVQYDIVIIGTD